MSRIGSFEVRAYTCPCGADIYHRWRRGQFGTRETLNYDGTPHRHNVSAERGYERLIRECPTCEQPVQADEHGGRWELSGEPHVHARRAEQAQQPKPSQPQPRRESVPPPPPPPPSFDRGGRPVLGGLPGLQV